MKAPAFEAKPFSKRGLIGTVRAVLDHHHDRPENFEIRLAVRIASPTSSLAAITQLTRPQRSASAASMILPVRHISIAFDLPIKRVSRCVPPPPGVIPTVTSS